MCVDPCKSKKAHRRAIFLDRDGVINRKLPEDHYVRRPSEFELLPEVLKALAIFRDIGFALVVVTNQRGIARGMMTFDDLDIVHNFMKTLFKDAGLHIDGLYYCPHDKTDYCYCRKPAPGMILEAAKNLDIDLGSSFMVGDSKSDVKAGKNAGVKSVLISPSGDPMGADMVFRSLLAFAEFLRDKEISSEK
ncbi:MAG: D-glycero-alpha-D-manno-heptose-1,7-bisphosphate 7-phosphatase [Desulfomonilaceae bacterium]